jgi:hypothetical protein
MGRQDGTPSVTALQRWLYTAAILRLFSVYLGFFDWTKFRTNLYSGKPDLVTELQGRTFAVWTITTCALCLICAKDPKVPSIYGATLFSFLVAFLHFAAELLVFKTTTPLSALSPLLVSGISVLWMGLGWSYYTNYAARGPQHLEVLTSLLPSENDKTE